MSGPSSWLLRRAASADLDAIMAIERSVFGRDAWSRQAMLAELEAPSRYYLLAIPVDADGGPEDAAPSDAPGQTPSLHGYAGLAVAGAQGDIQTIAVVPGVRGRGLGRVLMQQLLTEARQRGADEVFLEVRADNPAARGLYERLGFEAIAVRPRYYQPDDVDAIVMRLALAEPQTTLAPEQARSSEPDLPAAVPGTVPDEAPRGAAAAVEEHPDD